MSDGQKGKKAPNGSNLLARLERDGPTYVERDQADEIAAVMRTKHILADARIAASIGIREEHYNLAYNRGRYENGDERDEYLYRQVDRARAEVESWLQEQWITGRMPGAQSYLLALCKRYNQTYMRNLESELEHSFAIIGTAVVRRFGSLGVEAMLEAMDEIRNFDSAFAAAEIEVRLDAGVTDLRTGTSDDGEDE